MGITFAQNGPSLAPNRPLRPDFTINIALNHTKNKQHIYIYTINPFKPNGISDSYQLDKSISALRVVGWYFSFLFKF